MPIAPGFAYPREITKAAGGVGIWAVQLAKLINLHVTATTGPYNADFVRTLGADIILDYRKTNNRTWVAEDPAARKVEIVLDCIGPPALEQAWHAVKAGGQVSTIAHPHDMNFEREIERPAGVDESVEGRFFIMHPSGVQLGEISRLIEEGKVGSMVDSVYKLEEFEQALGRMAGGGTRDKVVLRGDDQE